MAVKIKRRKVKIPPYIIKGFPKNSVRAILWIISLFNNDFACHERMYAAGIIKRSRGVEGELEGIAFGQIAGIKCG